MAKQCVHAIVSGLVQGVFYRDCTRRKAQELQLTGWVRNLDDGSVEVLACGEPDIITVFIDWLWQGSPNSNVEDVKWQHVALQEFDGLSGQFSIR
jgi:acylphosphatase